jgi:predicted Zn-dependent protease
MRRFILIAALAAGGLISTQAAHAAGGWNAETPPVHSTPGGGCPARADLDATLGQASDLMRQSRLRDAAALLQPLSASDCDAHASLLLAAAFEAQEDSHQAIEVLQHAHSVWPLNNSLAASLARIDLESGQKDSAAKALSRFRPGPGTPEQELEMAAVVFLAVNQPLSAQKFAEQDYKLYPSAHSLLLLANTLQMQGRYPEVNRILAARRATYSDSAEFLVTLAESEFDASMYPAARADARQLARPAQ